SIFGTLRAIGVTRRQLGGLILVEAWILALIGFLVGAAIGVWLGDTLMGHMTRTLGDLYYQVRNPALHLHWTTFAIAAAVTLAAATMAAVLPARQARSITPALTSRIGTEQRAERRARRGLMVALASLVLAGIFVGVPSRDIELGFAALFAVVVAAVAIAPEISRVVSRGLGSYLHRLGAPRLSIALSGISAATSRVGIAVSAMMVALATTLSIAIMIDSFRVSVSEWLGGTLQADFYISRTDDGTLSDGVASAIAGVGGVREISQGHRIRLRGVDGQLHRVFVLAPAPSSLRSFRLLSANPEAQTQWQAGRGVWVSEPYAFRHALSIDDSVELISPRGTVALRVLGIYRDYSSEHGVILIHREGYERAWGTLAMRSMGVYGDDESIANTMRTALVAKLAALGEPALVRSNRELTAASLEVFDRTFLITEALRIVALVVAAIGIANALMAMQLERGHELAVMRVVGLTPRGLFMVVEYQAMAIGLIAAVLAIPLGVVLSAVLIDVVNRRSFGWSMTTIIERGLMVETVALALASAAIAGLYPARHLLKAPLARLLSRGE
ncbi:MAG: FtsX-like permease family protein, partial [Pseudomonadota bacterium]